MAVEELVEVGLGKPAPETAPVESTGYKPVLVIPVNDGLDIPKLFRPESFKPVAPVPKLVVTPVAPVESVVPVAPVESVVPVAPLESVKPVLLEPVAPV